VGLDAAVAPAREVALEDERPNELLVLPWGPRPHHVVRCGIDVVDLHAVNATRLEPLFPVAHSSPLPTPLVCVAKSGCFW
jgi:hypothetical protein